jgi:hypothetical protein
MSTSKPHTLHPDDEGRKVLQNLGILSHNYTGSQSRSPQLGSKYMRRERIK